MIAPVDLSSRVISIQLLRFVAALLVATLHQAFAFADYMGTGLGIAMLFKPATQAGNIAVCVFFVVSGYIMVVSSRQMFGMTGARRVFWTRRLVRILPPYWIATILLVLILLVLRGESIGAQELAKSLMLWPYWSGAPFTLALPIMWVGWTLFFEMVFYFLFGLFVSFSRLRAIALTSLALVGLVVAGQGLSLQSAPLWMATRPVALVFIAGMVLALWRERGHVLPPALRLLALAMALALPFIIGAPDSYSSTTLEYLGWAAVPAVLLSLALMGGEMRWPWPAMIDRLGDISFALYLLHVPAAHFWTFVWQSLTLPGGAWPFLVTLVAGTVIASWLFFVWVERPTTRWLNERLGAGRGKTCAAVQPS